MLGARLLAWIKLGRLRDDDYMYFPPFFSFAPQSDLGRVRRPDSTADDGPQKREARKRTAKDKEDHASGGGGGAVGSRPADTRTSETARVRTVPRSRC